MDKCNEIEKKVIIFYIFKTVLVFNQKQENVVVSGWLEQVSKSSQV